MSQTWTFTLTFFTLQVFNACNITNNLTRVCHFCDRMEPGGVGLGGVGLCGGRAMWVWD